MKKPKGEKVGFEQLRVGELYQNKKKGHLLWMVANSSSHHNSGTVVSDDSPINTNKCSSHSRGFFSCCEHLDVATIHRDREIKHIRLVTKRFSKDQMAMGQNPISPVNIPIPTKIGSKMGGEFSPTPKWHPKTVLTHSQISSSGDGVELVSGIGLDQRQAQGPPQAGALRQQRNLADPCAAWDKTDGYENGSTHLRLLNPRNKTKRDRIKQPVIFVVFSSRKKQTKNKGIVCKAKTRRLGFKSSQESESEPVAEL